MRGHGNQQLRFADGAQLDWMAEELGLDPLEIRLKNAVQAGDVLLNGSKVDSCGFSECLEKVAEKSGWKEKKQSSSKALRGIEATYINILPSVKAYIGVMGQSYENYR